ncbi:MAG: FtsW/RodA/SpoVE family cell cycle protein, partial [Massilia sp.]
TGTHSLRAGESFRIGGSEFKMTSGEAFAGADHDWRYDGATLWRDGSAQSTCPGTPAPARIVALWNRIVPARLTSARPFTFGGNLNCGNRIAIANLAAATAQLTREDGALVLAASGQARAPMLITSAKGELDLAQQEESLAGISAVQLGRVRMLVYSSGERLTLRPQRHLDLYTETTSRQPEGVAWTWQQRGTWTVPSGGPWSVMALFGSLIIIALLFGRWPVPGKEKVVVTAALLVVAGLGALLFQRAGASVGVGWSMLLAWAALWGALLVTQRANLATNAALLLLAAGLLAQLELGLGAMESSWLRHFQKTSAMLAIGLGIGMLWQLRASRPLWPQRRIEWLLAAVAGVSLLALATQVLFGDETGVFDLQPVEFSKLALTVLTAHCIALGLGREQGRLALRLVGPALLFAALLALALVEVDDYSPLILLLVWSMAMAMAWSLATKRRVLSAGLAAVGISAIASIAWVRIAGVEQVVQWGFYADRFAVWLDPARHPHTGQQLLLGAHAIAQGAWWGADNWLGIGGLGEAAGAALHIPAVQDDFAPSFFINRHGLLGALALWTLQVLFLAGLAQTALRAFAASVDTRDFRQAWVWRFRCFVLCGGVAFVLGHLLLSWGTNLSIFPIMGQPMSFLSAGGSHLLFFICPLLAFNAVSAQSFEEKPTCRSTSNTKSWAR